MGDYSQDGKLMITQEMKRASEANSQPGNSTLAGNSRSPTLTAFSGVTNHTDGAGAARWPRQRGPGH